MKLNQLLRYMDGPGGRNSNNRPIQGMTLKSLKHHVALQPLFIIMGGGIAFVAYYCWRLAATCPDVAWRKQAEPWQSYRNAQYKFMNPNSIDYSNACKAPKYQD